MLKSKRIAPIISDGPSLKMTLTNEILDLGIDPEKEDNLKMIVSVIELTDGKRIVIESIKR